MTVDRVRVGDVLALQRRAVAVEPDLEYEEIGVRSFGRGIFHKEPVSGLELGNKRVFRIEPGDIVLSNVFAWEGAVALASEAEAGRIGSHRFMTFTPVGERIDPSWARWWFLSEPGLGLIRQASPGSAGRNRTLAIDRFEALEIPLPSIEEQRRVATRLDRVDVRIREARKRGAQAAALRDAVTPAMRQAIVSSLVGERRALMDVAVVTMGQSPPGDSYNERAEGVPLLNGPTEFGREVPTARQWTTAATKIAQPGDLLMCVRASVGRMNRADQRYCIGRGLAAIRPLDGILDAEFLRHSLIQLAPEIMSRTAGSTFANLSGAKLLKLPLPVPDIATQRRFAAEMTAAELKVERVQHMGRRVHTIVGSILPAALNEAFAGLS
jgi:type I restriction enzyme S subunit